MHQEGKRVGQLRKAKSTYTPELDYCWEMLIRVSRSFYFVFAKLPERLRDPVCILYLVLRALDTVEDDMDLPLTRKIPLLLTFHEHLKDKCDSPV
jgi:farnesyl-diphosphate farnesyltransferase